jgi:predicted alpha/beta-fold hydrolase
MDCKCRLRQYARRHKHQFELVGHVDSAEVARARVITEFDAAASSKLAGFDSIEQYYRAGSSAQFVPHIRTPTLFLASEDDPFLGALPIEQCRQNEHTVLATTTVGGHCAHLQGLLPLGRSWADAVMIEFIRAVQSELHP